MIRFFSLLIMGALAGCSPTSESSTEALGSGGKLIGTTNDVAAKGPFGIDFGTPIDKIDGAKKLDTPGLYEIASPPKQHADFERVVVLAYPETGICVIRGIGKNLEGDGAGSQIQSKLDSLDQALELKYGKSKKSDVCNGSIQCDPQFWMMTLSQGERAYGYKWSKPDGAMKRGVGEIYLIAQADDIQTSYPILEFHSDRQKECDLAEKKSSVETL